MTKKDKINFSDHLTDEFKDSVAIAENTARFIYETYKHNGSGKTAFSNFLTFVSTISPNAYRSKKDILVLIKEIEKISEVNSRQDISFTQLMAHYISRLVFQLHANGKYDVIYSAIISSMTSILPYRKNTDISHDSLMVDVEKVFRKSVDSDALTIEDIENNKWFIHLIMTHQLLANGPVAELKEMMELDEE